MFRTFAGKKPTSKAFTPKRKLQFDILEDRVVPASVLINVPNRRDLVYDASRNQLLVTTSIGLVHRVDATNNLLTDLNVSGNLKGGDTTTNGNFLFVADDNTNRIRRVDLSSGAVTDFNFTLQGNEVSGWDFNIVDANRGFLTTRTTSGVGIVREFNISTGAFTLRNDANITQGNQTNIYRANDRSTLLFTANTANAPVYTYLTGGNSFNARADLGGSNFSRLGAVNRNGTLFGMERRLDTNNVDGAIFFDGAFQGKSGHFNPASTSPGVYGVFFDAARDIAYVADAATDQIIAYNTSLVSAWTERFRLPVGEDLLASDGSSAFGNGVMAVSNDGSKLYLSVPGGIRAIDTPTATGVATRFEVANYPRITGTGVANSFTITARDAFGQIATGFTGTVTLSSSLASNMPATVTFFGGDNGVKTLNNISMSATGTAAISATAGTVVGQQTGIVVHNGTTNAVTLLPITNKRDSVMDVNRNILYISTNDGQIERYNLTTKTLLAPWKVGNSLNGMEISADGNSLYVAEGLRNATQGNVRKINLNTGAVTTIWYDLEDFTEGGAWDFGTTGTLGGKVFFSVRSEANNNVKLRQINPVTNAVSDRLTGGSSIRPDTYLAVSTDKSRMYLAEANTGLGTIRRYTDSTDSFDLSFNGGSSHLQALTTNTDGSRIAVPFASNLRTYDSNFNQFLSLSFQGGTAFDPYRNWLFVADEVNDVLRVIDPTTGALIGSPITTNPIPIGENIAAGTAFGNGEMTISTFADYAFLHTNAGVRVINTGVQLPRISVNDVTMTEGNSGTTDAVFTISLFAPSPIPITVSYGTLAGTATPGVDYQTTSGSVTFAPGETSKTVLVPVNGDLVFEPDETFSLVLFPTPTFIPVTKGTGNCTIINDEPRPTMSIGDVSLIEGNAGTSVMTFTVSLSLQSYQTITVDYNTFAGTATAGSDFVAITGSLSFAPLETSKTIAVTIFGDVIYETNETFSVSLGTLVNADFQDSLAVGTITNDEAIPVLNFSPVVSSGPEGGPSPIVTVTMSGASQLLTTVGYSIIGGTATNGIDYTFTPGVLQFASGETTKTIPLSILNEFKFEPDETVILGLSSPANAVLGNSAYTHTILNDDILPVANLQTTVASGRESQTQVSVIVTLDVPVLLPVSVTYSVIGGTATGNGIDYSLPTGVLTFAPGEVQKSFTLNVINDTLLEADETVIVQLSNPQDTALGPNTVFNYTILDDEAPTLRFDTATQTVTESNSTLTVTVLRSLVSNSLSSLPTVARYEVLGGTASYALDYRFPNDLQSGEITFAPGETVKTFTINLLDDSVYEGTETLVIGISPVENGDWGNPRTQTITIVDNEPVPVISLNVSPSSGSESTTPTLSINLSSPAGAPVVIDLLTNGGTALINADYTVGLGTFVLNPGQTNYVIPFSILNDTLRESNETVSLRITNPFNAILGASTISYTIIDDDPLPIVSFASTGTSGLETVLNHTFAINLTNPSSSTITVPYTVTGGTATANVDYRLANGTLTFAPGVTFRTLTLAIINDTRLEADETVRVNLGTPTNAALGTPNNFIYTILDDETPRFTFASNNFNGRENVANQSVAVQLTRASSTAVTVRYDIITGGTATSNVDYRPASGTLTFNPGQTVKTIPLTLINDLRDENDETFFIRLSNPTGSARLGTIPTTTFTILDDDAAPVVSFVDNFLNVVEGATTLNVEVTLSETSDRAITVDYKRTGGTASEEVDFLFSPGTLTFQPGETSKTFALQLLQDSIVEADETILLALQNTNGQQGNFALELNITDDETVPEVTFDSFTSSYNESAGTVSVIVRLSSSSSSVVTIDYALDVGGTATNGIDHAILPPGTLTFAVGETEKTIVIQLTDDAFTEGDETVILNLFNPVNANLGGIFQHVLTILAND